ncbi:MAG: PAS domain-containing protein [Alphaproteobacteria bacterium]
MFHPDTQFLIDRWVDLARQPEVRGGLPPRSKLRPEVLGSRLPRTFLLEGTGPDTTFRLSGSWLEALQDRALGGARFLDIWCAASPALVVPALAQAVREARPIVIVAHGPQATPVEVTVAPLRGAEGRPGMFLGLIAPASATRSVTGHAQRLAARLTVAVGDRGRPALCVVDDRRSA